MVVEKSSEQISSHIDYASPIDTHSYVKNFGNSDYHNITEPSLQKYLNEKSIAEMIKVNSEIEKIFAKFRLSVTVNMKILNTLVRNHLPETSNIALGIVNYLPQKFKHQVNKKALIEATNLHDIAKVIMPEHIINKAGTLTDEEREIMKEHAALSYEMLKTTDLSEETLNLIKDHHKTHDLTLFNNSDEDFIPEINLQILSMADIYSALREKRCYKAEMNKDEALKIIQKETQEGKFHPHLYRALMAYTEAQELAKVNRKGQSFYSKLINRFRSQISEIHQSVA